MSRSRKPLVGMLVVVAVMTMARPVLAGPPFICHQFDIGSAASLPWDPGDQMRGRADYKVANLVADTQALLAASTPIVVRMETLRRATLYATHDRQAAARLLAALTERADALEREGRPNGLAWFDVAYITEAFRETATLATDSRARWQDIGGLAGTVDGYALILKSLTLRPNDPGIEFAAALLSRGEARQAHVVKVRAAADRDPLLARNIKYL